MKLLGNVQMFDMKKAFIIAVKAMFGGGKHP